jgi:hypothetical protein
LTSVLKGIMAIWTLSIICYSKRRVWKLDLFPYSGEGVGDTYTVGSIRKKLLNHWTNPDTEASERYQTERRAKVGAVT